MNMFLDCEFDGFDGPLISIGMIDSFGRGFYGILNKNAQNTQSQWVKDNVIPVIAECLTYVRVYETEEELVKGICDYLSVYSLVTIIADWPADLGYFFKYITNNGMVRHLPAIKAHLIPALSTASSRVPHNAFEDAVALKDSFNGLFKREHQELT